MGTPVAVTGFDIVALTYMLMKSKVVMAKEF
jgi:hypothetical protein